MTLAGRELSCPANYATNHFVWCKKNQRKLVVRNQIIPLNESDQLNILVRVLNPCCFSKYEF